MPVVAGAGVLAVVIFAGISGSGGATSADTGSDDGSRGGRDIRPVITAAPIVVNTDPAIVKTNLTHTIGKGNAGDDVKQVQQRLTDLGFAPGPVDGLFGSGTQQAVWAYEKLVLKTPRAAGQGPGHQRDVAGDAGSASPSRRAARRKPAPRTSRSTCPSRC